MNQRKLQRENNYLITGAFSGLGKYLHKNLGGSPLTRLTSNKKKERIKKIGVNIIIHCAFNSDSNPKSLDQYFQDNVSLTEELTKIPHHKFIFISSVDVYFKGLIKHTEDEKLDADGAESLYAKTKLLSEGLIRENCSNFLILRCTALLGKDSRENSLIKIIKKKNPTLTLSADSVFNYILHKDILDFIKLAVKKDLQGIYNLASSENITLSDVENLLKKQVNFGTYTYDVGEIDNSKISGVFPAFKKTSKEAILQFIKE